MNLAAFEAITGLAAANVGGGLNVSCRDFLCVICSAASGSRQITETNDLTGRLHDP